MKYVIVVAPFTSVTTDFTDHLISQTKQLHENCEAKFAVFLTDSNLEKCISDEKANGPWSNCSVVECLSKQPCVTEFTSSVVDELFRLADKLPYVGSRVDILLYLTSVDQTSKSILSLCGAFRRLTDWHNAHVTILKGDNSSHDCVLSLQTFLKASVIETCNNIVFDDSLWRGKVAVIDKSENKGFILSGFVLDRCRSDEASSELFFPQKHLFNQETKDNVENEPAVLGRMFEVLDEVDVCSVPSFMFTPHRFQLSLRPGHVQSQTFWEHIKQNPETGILVRILCYNPSTVFPVCKDKVLSSTSWMESIIIDTSYCQEPEEEYLPGYEFIHFLLLSRESDCVNSSSVSAHLLRSPQQLNGAMFSHLYHQSLLPCEQAGDDEVRDLLSGLLDLKEDTVSQMTSDLIQLQTQFLSTIHDKRKSKNLGVDELYSVLTDVQRLYMEELGHHLPRLGEVKIPVSQLKQVVSELSTNPANWPERLQMMMVESQKKSLSRMQSTDSMQLSSPIQPDPASSAIEVQDFLKFFRSDGSAAADHLSPIRRQRNISVSRMSQQPEDDLSNISWPNAVNVKYHGVHYNKDKKSERHEQHYSKLRDRYVTDETYSWCSSPGFAITKTKEKDKAPLRRSPRKRVSQQVYGEVSFSESRSSLNASKLLKCTENQTKIKSRPSTSRCYSAHDSSPKKQKSVKQNKDENVVPVESESIDSSQSKHNSVSQSAESSRQSKESRSQRHKRRLESIVQDVLKREGVDKNSDIYAACSTKLFKVTKLFVMDLPTSENLREEMRKIAESQVEQVIDLEKRRRTSTRR